MKEGQQITCAYKCTDSLGELICEKTDFKFVIGSGKCLKGFEEAVKQLSSLESKVTITLKSPYGKRGMAPNVPGDTDLTF